MNRDLALRINQLLTTGYEGLEHVGAKNKLGEFEEGMFTFKEVVEAFDAIQSVLTKHLGSYEEDLAGSYESLCEGFSHLVDSYERKDIARYQQLLELTLLPRYRAYQEVIGALLLPYTSL